MKRGLDEIGDMDEIGDRPHFTCRLSRRGYIKRGQALFSIFYWKNLKGL